MSFNFKIRSLQLFNHVLLIIGLVYAGVTDQWKLLWISLGMYILFLPLGTVCGLHRLLTHRSYKTSKIWEYTLSILSIYATLGSAVTWVAVHRMHHKYSDKDNDPHSPYINKGLGEIRKFDIKQAFKSWVGIWDISNIPPTYALELIRNPFYKFTHRHYFTIIAIGCIVLAMINPWLIVFAYAIPACMALHATSVINILAHYHGYQTYQVNDGSSNSWIGNVITFGEGWHNNHHAHPTNWTTQEQWWEIDPCGWFIKLIKKDDHGQV